MGGTTSSHEQVQQAAERAAASASTAAARAAAAAAEARASEQQLQLLREELLTIVREQPAEPEAIAAPPRRWWQRSEPEVRQRQAEEAQRLLQLQTEARMAIAEARTQTATLRAQLHEAEARASSQQATATAQRARADASEAALTPWRNRATTAERKVKQQEYMWAVALAIGLLVGAVIGGLVGAAVAGSGAGGTEASIEPGRPGIVMAVVGLTRQVLSLANVLTLVGSLALTAVYVFGMVVCWTPLAEQGSSPDEEAICNASRRWALLSLGYGAMLYLVGDRALSRGDEGSRLVGGLFHCGVAMLAPVVVACGMRVLGWRWLTGVRELGGPGRQSLADCGGGHHPAAAVALVASAGAETAMLLYLRSSFPLLMMPALTCSYVGFVALAAVLWQPLGLPRYSTALLQPESLATLLFSCTALAAAGVGEAPPAVRLAFLVGGMTSLLVALPAALLGILDLRLPGPATDTSGAGGGQPTTSLYAPLPLGSHCVDAVRRVQASGEFAFAGAVYMAVWVSIMTTALQLRLLTCRPFALASIALLCVVAPRRSPLWDLAFKLPVGFWLLAVAVLVEHTGDDEASWDPILREVLRLLGPRPAPFLQLLDGALQVATVCTAMTCLVASLESVAAIFERTWLPSALAWLLCLLSMATRTDVHGASCSFCFALWALGLYILGTQLIPRWSVAARLAAFAFACRLFVLGHDSFLLLVGCGLAAGFVFFGLAFGEVSQLRIMLHAVGDEDGPAAPWQVRLLASLALLAYAAASDAALLLALSCFCLYAALASLAPVGMLERCIVVAVCGLATVLLGEAVQGWTGPLQVAVAELVTRSPLHGGPSQGGLPLDLLALRSLLRKLVLAMSGDEGA